MIKKTSLILLILAVWIQSAELSRVELTDEQTELLNAAPEDTLAKQREDSIKLANSPDTVEYKSLALKYWLRKGSVQLSGSAELKYRGSQLLADTIVYDTRNKMVEATGYPTIKDLKNPPIAGYKMRYDIERKIGRVFYGTAKDGNQYFNGMDIRRLPDQRLLISRGDISTRDSIEDQSYYFYSRRMSVKPNGTVVAKPVVLNIMDVPVAILPFMVAPLNKGRASGLLTPKFGGDQSQGFYLENLGVYWATNDYMDVDFRTDIREGEAGTFDELTLKSNFRYKTRYTLNGNVDWSYYLDEFNPDISDWDLHFNHSQKLTPDNRFSLSGSGSFSSSKDVRQEKGLSSETILDQQANAQLTLRKQFKNNATANLELKQDLNFTPVNNKIKTTRVLPRLTLSHSDALFPDHSWDDSDTLSEEEWYRKLNYNWSFKFENLLRENEITGNALDSGQIYDTLWAGAMNDISLSYQGSLFEVFNITPQLHLKSYWTDRNYTSETDSTLDWTLEPTKGEVGSFFHEFDARISANTKIYGIWKPEWGRFTGIRHTISPDISLIYAPEIDTNHLMRSHPGIHSGSYFQSEQRAVGFSIGNDFDLKWKKAMVDSQQTQDNPRAQYNTLKFLSIRSSGQYNYAADSLHWSDISSSVTLQPTQSHNFTVHVTHSMYDSWGDSPNDVVDVPILKSYRYGFNKSFSLQGGIYSGMPGRTGPASYSTWDANLSYGYNFLANRVSPTAFSRSINHSSSFSLRFQPTPAWSLNYSTHYDFNNGEFAMHKLQFNRTLARWKMEFRWTPTGPAEGWYFMIYLMDIPDIKFETGSENNSYNNN